MKIGNNVGELVGGTPLVYLNKIGKGLPGKIAAKMEMMNPCGSVKDRIAWAMILDAEKKGLLGPGGIIIEPTSGNTGIGLASVAASRGYRLILAMPESMSMERRQLLSFLGAEIVLTPAEKGMKGAVERAEELMVENPGAFMPQQFKNPANSEIHRKTTALEIWNDTDGKVDIFVGGVGTGGTITGVSEILKQKNPEIKSIAVEPASSPVLSGEKPGPHKIQGIGAGFIPEILNRGIIDEIIRVSNEDAGKTSRRMAKEEGILCGISAGAAVWAALEVASREESKDKLIVVVLPDSAERYLSTWLVTES
ncbi:MAG: cysteine synthase A [Chloroflexi bacterium]|nr:cysteine synthase A [Chloroflexota bacterium]